MGPLISSLVVFLSLLASQIKQIPTLVCSNHLGKPRNVACSDFLVLKIFCHVLVFVVEFACVLVIQASWRQHVRCYSVSEELMFRLDR